MTVLEVSSSTTVTHPQMGTAVDPEAVIVGILWHAMSLLALQFNS
jgi:hypothetical protein